MKLHQAITIYGTSGGQMEPPASEKSEKWMRRYLQKKREKLIRLGNDPGKMQGSHDEPAPEDVKKLRKKSYKSGMKKARTSPKISLNAPPGAVPWQSIQGRERTRDVQCVIVRRGKKWCVTSEDGQKNLGCGRSQDWAHKRLAEVEYFKNR